MARMLTFSSVARHAKRLNRLDEAMEGPDSSQEDSFYMRLLDRASSHFSNMEATKNRKIKAEQKKAAMIWTGLADLAVRGSFQSLAAMAEALSEAQK
jgi:hypothetical protein